MGPKKTLDDIRATLDKLTDIQKNFKSLKEQIQDENEVINEFMKKHSQVSFQTNILAINATIEAAKAKEYGKGFSVVADEVRKLATLSEKSSKKVHKSLKNMDSITKKFKEAEVSLMHTIEQAYKQLEVASRDQNEHIEVQHENIEYDEATDSDEQDGIDETTKTNTYV